MNTNPTAPAPEPTIEQHSALSPTEHQAAIADLKALVAQGKLTPDQAATAFDELGVPPEQRTDTRTEGAKELDEAGFTAAPPEAFDAVRFHHPNDTPSPEQRQAATITRTWLAAAELPRDLGNTVFKTGHEVAMQIQGMSDAEREQWARVENEKLRRVYGAELERKLEMAGHMVNQIEARQPGLKKLLSQLGDSARLASLLIQQSERFWARRKG